MSLRSAFARAAGRSSARAMRLLGKGATTLPGRIALALDPDAIDHAAELLERGSVVVCGTNGKTTTNNVLAAAVERAGMRVACNRAGANMASGIAAAAIGGTPATWGVFESDELSTRIVVPRLKPRVFVLLNLFRDQLDRCGEIDRVQQTLVDALVSSPGTLLLYNADDPLCRGVALRAREGGVSVRSFGIDQDLHLPAERVTGGAFCQVCGAPLAYEYRQYGQLGSYGCTACSFSRGSLDVRASDVRVDAGGVAFSVRGVDDGRIERVEAAWGGTYMVYNLLAAYTAARIMGVSADDFLAAVAAYDPGNGRLQRFSVAGREVTLNLAKNPTGFNQNMALLAQDDAPKAVFIVINDDYNDGRDVSWLWDVDFERLGSCGPVRVFAGGHRANDMQVRLKYAGVEAGIAGDVGDVLHRIDDLDQTWHLWVLTNYSALWPAKAELERLGERR